MDYPNADPIVGVIVSAGLASYAELKTSISLREAMDLWEIAIVNRHNEWLAMEDAKRQR
ncbi:hypothetical protein GCM10027398_43590 [Azotobacter salinestris]